MVFAHNRRYVKQAMMAFFMYRKYCIPVLQE